ncbi:MAG: glycosyltransferase family 4 protein [Candidatus Moranbacteria bacterium]|nr:glycosyltransferase family 4 protein [Candidatus Moranbacteria bacterium]OIQ01684.1 MAG: hypothetical protein AUK58_04140 [Candidatus Moranbacteria bacterium CG2_30_41_165]PIP25910.1 MAG: hypothetical protein COX32_00835 [Candidatus Moranbacteria bacterium CG23_combo_of_CG06-09_8_20_14_all_41_28]PIV86550.1 MAG: hypothetical protein COW50_00800 [Candidatus Moranbacteria bacterium CG17_big_fil_post_rev_8_21_14_2_50_41_107]PIW94282.1 MAG: hypothetical protein COZ86_01855 [Candidatus Moranbacter
MKILEVNKYAYLRRGAERHFLDVIDLLRRNGHQVSVFSMDYKREGFERDAKYQVSYVGYNDNDSTLLQRLVGVGRLFWSFEARRKMKALLCDNAPDIVHLHNIYHQLSPSILGPIKSAGIPIMMTVHDYNLISPDKDAYYPEVGKRYYKFLFMRKYRFGKRLLLVLKKYWEEWMGFYEKDIDIYIVPSLYVKNVLMQAGIKETQIIVIPHFIAKQPGEISSLVTKGTKKYALYGGSISKEKGVDTLIRIFEVLRIPLILAGECENNFTVPRSKYVTFLGKQTKEQMEVLMQDASCIVSGSILPETFGLLALEAGSFGKPFFGFLTGAFREIITDGENGYLASDEKMLQQYLQDFFEGKCTFSASMIQKQADDTFGEIAYLKHLEEVSHLLIDQK